MVKVLYLIDSNDLWIYIYKKGEARYSDLIDEFVKTGKRSKMTIIGYKKELEASVKIKKKIGSKTNRAVYYVPSEKIDEVVALIQKGQIAESIEQLPKNEREEYIQNLKHDEVSAILNALALNGSMLVSGIVEKTGFTETKIIQTIWGPILTLGLFNADKKYWLLKKEREYGLALCGLYRALGEDIENFEIIVQKWGHLHPFIFNRIDRLNEYGLVEPLKEFLRKVKPYSYTEGEEKTRKEIEKYLVAFIILGYNHRYIMDWLKFMHEDKQFRELVVGLFKKNITAYKFDIKAFEMGLGIVGKLGRRSEPNWDEMKWNIGKLHGLEGFLHFPWMMH